MMYQLGCATIITHDVPYRLIWDSAHTGFQRKCTISKKMGGGGGGGGHSSILTPLPASEWSVCISFYNLTEVVVSLAHILRFLEKDILTTDRDVSSLLFHLWENATNCNSFQQAGVSLALISHSWGNATNSNSYNSAILVHSLLMKAVNAILITSAGSRHEGNMNVEGVFVPN